MFLNLRKSYTTLSKIEKGRKYSKNEIICWKDCLRTMGIKFSDKKEDISI